MTEPPPKKLYRPSMVCVNCKKRKVKCDKKSPCYRCIKANLTDSCVYNSQFDDNNIQNNINELKDREPVNRKNIDIFNYKSLILKKHLFTKAGDTVKYESPMTINALFENNKTYSKIKSMMTYLFEPKDSEDFLKEEANIAHEELKLLHDIYTKEEIDDLINKFIKPNFDAIIERIDFFNRYMQTFFYGLMQDKLIDVLNEHFLPSETDPTGYIYIPLENDYSYSMFGTLFGALRIVLGISEYETEKLFEEPLTFTHSDASSCALKCIAYSNFMRKPVFQNVIAIILFRMHSFMSDSVSGNSNSSYFLDLAINLSFKLGIHIRCDEVPDFDEDVVKSTWNLLQFLEAVNSIYCGEPLKIDYKYCTPNLIGFWEPVILFLRNIVFFFNSMTPISINELIDLIDSTSTMLTLFRPFDEILNNSEFGPTESVFHVILKFHTLISISSLYFRLRLALDEINNYPFIISEEEQNLIDDYKLKSECQLFYGFCLSFRLMADISNGRISHKKQAARLTLMMRLLFSLFIRLGNKVVFCTLLIFNRTKNISNNTLNGGSSLKFTDIKIIDAEKNITRSFDEIKFEDVAFVKMNQLMSNLQCISEFLLSFYVEMADKDVLLSCGKFSFHFKFLLFVCFLVKNVNEYSKTIGNNTFLRQDWKNVIDKTTEYFINGQKDTINTTDWDFLENEEFLENIGYLDNSNNNNSDSGFDDLYQLFF